MLSLLLSLLSLLLSLLSLLLLSLLRLLMLLWLLLWLLLPWWLLTPPLWRLLLMLLQGCRGGRRRNRRRRRRRRGGCCSESRRKMFAESHRPKPRVQRLVAMKSGVMWSTAFVASASWLWASAPLVAGVAAIVAGVGPRPEGKPFVAAELPEGDAVADLMRQISAESAGTRMRVQMRRRIRLRMRKRMRKRRRVLDRNKLGLSCHQRQRLLR